jgi:hypothetical protein
MLTFMTKHQVINVKYIFIVFIIVFETLTDIQEYGYFGLQGLTVVPMKSTVLWFLT